MDYVVAIPSYDRADVLNKKTLKLLHNRGIKSENIYIFVANEKEKKIYSNTIKKDLYNNIIVGKKGISYQRNFIIDYFDEGQYIIFIDDDITNVKIKQGNNVLDLKDFNIFFNNAYKILKEQDKYIWTTKNMYNPFYKNLMKDEIEIGMVSFSGDLMGIINRKKMKIKHTLKLGEAEQYEFLFMYYKEDGGVIRFNNIIVMTSKLTPGGKVSERGSIEDRKKDIIPNLKILEKKYPEYIKEIKYVKDGNSKEYRSRASLILKNIHNNNIIKGLKIKGGATYKKMLNIDLSDKDSNDIYYEPIDKTEKYLSMKEDLFNQLEQTRIGKIEGPRRDGKATRGSIIGYIGYTINFGCGGRRNLGVGEYRPNDRYPELFDKLVKFGNYILPKGYTYQVITVNKDVKAKRHKDKNNNGFTVATTLGNFTGGGLIVEKDGKDKTYNLKDHIMAFNGALLEHQTEPFKGRRYTIIYYKQKKPCKIKNKTLKGEGKKNDIVAKLHISPNKQKKYRAIFYEDGEEIKSVDFGAKNMSDYTIHKDKERKERYIKRHQKNEDWENPYTAGALSRWVLWEKPTLKSSWDFYKKKFNFI